MRDPTPYQPSVTREPVNLSFWILREYFLNLLWILLWILFEIPFESFIHNLENLTWGTLLFFATRHSPLNLTEKEINKKERLQTTKPAKQRANVSQEPPAPRCSYKETYPTAASSPTQSIVWCFFWDNINIFAKKNIPQQLPCPHKIDKPRHTVWCVVPCAREQRCSTFLRFLERCKLDRHTSELMVVHVEHSLPLDLVHAAQQLHLFLEVLVPAMNQPAVLNF